MFKKKNNDYILHLQLKSELSKVSAEKQVLYNIILELLKNNKTDSNCAGCKYYKKIGECIEYEEYLPYASIPLINREWIEFGGICTKISKKCKFKNKP